MTAIVKIVKTPNGNYDICKHGNGYTVQICGDEEYFESIDEAYKRIREDADFFLNEIE